MLKRKLLYCLKCKNSENEQIKAILVHYNDIITRNNNNELKEMRNSPILHKEEDINFDILLKLPGLRDLLIARKIGLSDLIALNSEAIFKSTTSLNTSCIFCGPIFGCIQTFVHAKFITPEIITKDVIQNILRLVFFFRNVE